MAMHLSSFAQSMKSCQMDCAGILLNAKMTIPEIDMVRERKKVSHAFHLCPSQKIADTAREGEVEEAEEAEEEEELPSVEAVNLLDIGEEPQPSREEIKEQPLLETNQDLIDIS